MEEKWGKSWDFHYPIARVKQELSKEESYWTALRKFDDAAEKKCLANKFQNKTMSMARTTGYTCTAAVNLLAEGLYTKKGISPPEFLGAHFDFINNYLAKRNVIYNVKKTCIAS